MTYAYVSVSSAVTARTSNTPRVATPTAEERSLQTFKSLFTLADVAARRRAGRSIKRPTSKTDENCCVGDKAIRRPPLVSLRRSKSSGDVAILGEISRALNIDPDPDHPEKYDAITEVEKSRYCTAELSSALCSEIPHTKSPTLTGLPSSTGLHGLKPTLDVKFDSETETLNVVDDALFVMLTPPQTPKTVTKNLTLAAHVPSLPKVASPFSPRKNLSFNQRPQQTCSSTRSYQGTGHTCASLHLTKSHWELRYDAWMRSLPSRTRRPIHSARSNTRPVGTREEETIGRSRFPAPPSNPALFPRAGMLTAKALRHHTAASDSEERSTLELDWALRAWPMDKIQRTLYVHDMDVRVWFPVTPSTSERTIRASGSASSESELNLQRAAGRPVDEEKERDRTLRRWEWDWELRWRVVEGMIEDEIERCRAGCDHDFPLIGANYQGSDAYEGYEAKAVGCAQTSNDDWEWSEDAMEIDAVL